MKVKGRRNDLPVRIRGCTQGVSMTNKGWRKGTLVRIRGWRQTRCVTESQKEGKRLASEN